MSGGVDVETRPWRLRGWVKGETKPRTESTIRGDKNLNDALARLEADATIDRTTVEQAW